MSIANNYKFKNNIKGATKFVKESQVKLDYNLKAIGTEDIEYFKIN